MAETIVSWETHEYEHKERSSPWYWTIGIIAAGVAISSFILQNYLFGVIALIAGFTIMLVGSSKPPKHTYSLTEDGFMVGDDLIPYEKMMRFAIVEDEPRHLTIECKTLIGVVKAPLNEDTDYRSIRMELKNRNIQEEQRLDAMVDRVQRWVGL